MKINVYAMLKTLLFTLQNGKSLSNGIGLLAKTAKTKKERNIYNKIYEDLREGSTFSSSLQKNKIGSFDITQFINMAEHSISFKSALEKIIHYIEIKDKFERESNDTISLPIIYFFIATLTVLGVKFFGVPIQMAKMQEYSQEINVLISNHLENAQLMADILFITLVVVASYFIILLIALFSQHRIAQGMAKELALILPFTSSIVLKFEKFMLFSMIGEMLKSGISLKNVMKSAIATTTVLKFKKAFQISLKSMKRDGKIIFHSYLYDNLEQELLVGVGSSYQVGTVLLEISDRARIDALELSTKFFRMITLSAIILMAFAVFIEFYTVVLTQTLIQKGLIDLTRGLGVSQ